MRPLASRLLDPIFPLAFGAPGFRLAARGFEPGDLDVDLTGRVCLVTGANAGIGRATAEALAARGATVHLLCRDRARGEEARADIAARTRAPGAVVLDVVDVADRAALRAYVAERAPPRVDVLVHNAGEYRTDRALTDDGFERMLAVGYLGPWLLTSLLRERLAASAPARVVVTSGIYHRRGRLDLADMNFAVRAWDPMAANHQMQLARASFAMELARRFDGAGVTVNAVHPGAVRTHAQDALTGWQRALMDAVGSFVFVDPARGALPNLKLAGEAALAGVTGRYFDALEEAEPSPLARDRALGEALWRWTEGALAPWTRAGG